MATGDNILTAICVSKECNLLSQNREMVSCEIENENGIDVLKWKKLEGEEEISQKEIDNSLNPIIEENKEVIKSNEFPDANSLIETTSNNINELYPPENINTMEMSKDIGSKKILNKEKKIFN